MQNVTEKKTHTRKNKQKICFPSNGLCNYRKCFPTFSVYQAIKIFAFLTTKHFAYCDNGKLPNRKKTTSSLKKIGQPKAETKKKFGQERKKTHKIVHRGKKTVASVTESISLHFCELKFLF